MQVDTDRIDPFESVRTMALNPSIFTEDTVYESFSIPDWINGPHMLLQHVPFPTLDDFICKELPTSGRSPFFIQWVLHTIIRQHYSDVYAEWMLHPVFSYRFQTNGTPTYHLQFFTNEAFINRIIEEFVVSAPEVFLPMLLDFFEKQAKYNLIFLTKNALILPDVLKNHHSLLERLESTDHYRRQRMHKLLEIIERHVRDVDQSVNYTNHLSDDETNAIIMFSINSRLINDVIRSDNDEQSEWVRPHQSHLDLLHRIDAIVERIPKLTQPLLLWRGMKLDSIDALRETNDHQYVSTSLSFSTTLSYLRGSSCCIILVCAKPGLPLLHIEHARPLTGQPFEFVLPRGTTLQRAPQNDIHIRLNGTSHVMKIQCYETDWTPEAKMLTTRRNLRPIKSDTISDTLVLMNPHMAYQLHAILDHLHLDSFKNDVLTFLLRFLYELIKEGHGKESIKDKFEKLKYILIKAFGKSEWVPLSTQHVFIANKQWIHHFDFDQIWAFRNKNFVHE